MQFYARFRDEDNRLTGDHRRARPTGPRARSPAFERLFDGALVQAHQDLLDSPGDISAKVRFVTIYHLILESTLGLTAFRFIASTWNARGFCPASSRGYSKIHHDETRHIGYGVWFLREAVRATRRCGNPRDARRALPLATPSR